ncbi:cysteine dioxygenase [Terrabacter terrigena]|uniref:Cysteine dioxygenase n=1 Tax=Terrabacter terrigena TaxID=574718 RepID=A0ABW3MZR4_9MICO
MQPDLLLPAAPSAADHTHTAPTRKASTMSRGAQRISVDLADTARRLSRQRTIWQGLVDFDPITRYYARLLADEHHEAWLLTWLPGQGTPWHDHGGSAGSFVVLQGVLTEEVAGYRTTVDLDGARRVTGPGVLLTPGDQRTFGTRHLHRVTNAGSDPAVSLHVYAPRLTAMTNYRAVAGVLEAEEHAEVGVDW